MSTVLTLAGFGVLVVGVLGVVKGGVHRAGLVGRKQSAWTVAAALAAMAAGGAMAPAPHPVSGQKAGIVASVAPTHPPEVVAAPSPSKAEVVVESLVSPAARPSRAAVVVASAFGPLLQLASGGDGDSWHDSRGVEYRMGLVNAPEVNECGGSTATAYRKRLLQPGFYARSYSTDTYGRRVSVIYTQSGVNLNVLMAREGIANDKYLAQYRNENPALARQLDAAFAQARSRHAGVWASCPTGTPPTPAARPQAFAGSGSSCHPDYRTCVPIKGDGSGRGSANDLDCGDIRQVVYLRTVDRDPYRLDSNSDGVGCESYA